MRQFLRQSCMCVAVLIAVPAAAQVPPLVNYQGRLTDAIGEPLSGNLNLAFRVFAAPCGVHPCGDVPVWGPAMMVVAVVDGSFNVVLGDDIDGDPIADAFNGPNRYVEITVDGAAPILPRQQVLSAPYALSSSGVRGTNVVTESGPTTLGEPVTVTGDIQVSGDLEVTSPAVSILGAAQSRVFGTVYEAETDGFVVASIQVGLVNGAVTWARIQGYSDSINPPVRLMAQDAAMMKINWGGDTNEYNEMGSVSFPVRRGEFWRVVRTCVSGCGSPITETLWWHPLGGGVP